MAALIIFRLGWVFCVWFRVQLGIPATSHVSCFAAARKVRLSRPRLLVFCRFSGVLALKQRSCFFFRWKRFWGLNTGYPKTISTSTKVAVFTASSRMWRSDVWWRVKDGRTLPSIRSCYRNCAASFGSTTTDSTGWWTVTLAGREESWGSCGRLHCSKWFKLSFCNNHPALRNMHHLPHEVKRSMQKFLVGRKVSVSVEYVSMSTGSFQRGPQVRCRATWTGFTL